MPTPTPRHSRFITNAFGLFAYASLVTQWIWSAVVVVQLLLNDEGLKKWINPQPAAPQPPLISIDSPSPLLIGVVLCFTAIILVGTVVIALRLPRQIGRSARQATHGIARKTVPVVARHKSVSKRYRRELSTRIILATKLVVTLLPVLFVLPPAATSASSLPSDLIHFIAATMAIVTLVWFSAEYLAARWLRVPVEQLY